MMTKEEAVKAFREAASEEFRHIPEEQDIEYEFSEKFIKRTEKLFEKVERNAAYTISSRGKRAFSALTAAVIISLLGVMSVTAIREPVVDFFVKRFEGFDEVYFEGETSEKINYVYSFSREPEGFTEIHRISNDKINIVQYQNSKSGSTIELCQTATDDTSLVIENKSGKASSFDINGQKVCIYMNNYPEEGRSDYYYAFWVCEGYSISITYSGVAGVEEIVELIKTVK